MAQRLSELGLPELSKLWVETLALPDNRIGRRHEFLGMVALGVDPDAVKRIPLARQWLAASVGGHHGVWHLPMVIGSSEVPALARSLCEGPWGRVQREVVAVVARAVGLDPTDTPEVAVDRAGVIVTLLTGLTILADWVASSDDIVMPGLELVARGCRPDAAEWLSRREDEIAAVIGWVIGSYAPPDDPRATVLGSDKSGVQWSPRPLQRDAEQVGGGAWFVAYPTGEGKTEAALLRHMAGDKEGLVFGMPTRATTDAMQRRLEQLLRSSGNSVVLSHQYAAAHEVECWSEYGLAWYSSSIRRLVAPVVAATIDQVLVGALRQKHAALRLLALANHHVVLDEVHTYDQYQAHLLKGLLAWWGVTNTPVTLLSATMPTWQQREFAEAYRRGAGRPAPPARYPSHWIVLPDGGLGEQREPPLSAEQPGIVTDLVTSEDPLCDHVTWAVRTHTRFPQCRIAVIRSTVDGAIATAQALKEELVGRDIDVVCLHSRMTLGHRTAVQDQLVCRLGPSASPGRPVLVVATQVIEASLDYDFDLMSTDIAPATSIVQRAGRLWRFRDATGRRGRFGKMPPERVQRVVVPTENGMITRGSSLPYFASELARVAAWLRATPTVRIPDDVQAFVDDTTTDLATVQAGGQADEEIAEAARMIGSANFGVSDLAGGLCRRGRVSRYGTLHALTDESNLLGGLEDEHRMRTRFIERESATFLLVGGSHGSSSTIKELNGPLSGARRREALNATVPSSGAVYHAMMQAHVKTLQAAGFDQWRPYTAMLRGLLPVDAEGLAESDLGYDADFGLLRRSSVDAEEPQTGIT